MRDKSLPADAIPAALKPFLADVAQIIAKKMFADHQRRAVGVGRILPIRPMTAKRAA